MLYTKIILVDACRVDDDDDNNSSNVRAAGAKQFSSTIMATTEGNTVRGGKIAFTITMALKKNYNMNHDLKFDEARWQRFRSIRKAAKMMIQKNTDQALIVNEHDDDIDDVIFLPKGYDKNYDKNASALNYNEEQKNNDDRGDENNILKFLDRVKPGFANKYVAPNDINS